LLKFFKKRNKEKSYKKALNISTKNILTNEIKAEK